MLQLQFFTMWAMTHTRRVHHSTHTSPEKTYHLLKRPASKPLVKSILDSYVSIIFDVQTTAGFFGPSRLIFARHYFQFKKDTE